MDTTRVLCIVQSKSATFLFSQNDIGWIFWAKDEFHKPLMSPESNVLLLSKSVIPQFVGMGSQVETGPWAKGIGVSRRCRSHSSSQVGAVCMRGGRQTAVVDALVPGLYAWFVVHLSWVDCETSAA